VRWTEKDIKQYLPEKEYIDTLLIPMIPFDPASDQMMGKQAFQREINQIFTNLIEKEYRGRIFLAPEYYYISGAAETEVSRLNSWISQFRKQPFTHVFLLTFDAKWKKHEDELTGKLLWVPAIQSGNIQSTETQSFVKEQAGQISELIQAYW